MTATREARKTSLVHFLYHILILFNRSLWVKRDAVGLKIFLYLVA